MLPISVRVDAVDASVAIPLATFGALPPPLPVRLTKHDLLASIAGIDLAVRSDSEVVLQTYELPLSAFAALDPRFDPAHVERVSIEVARDGDGALWIAEPALVP